MNTFTPTDIHIVNADVALRDRLGQEWGDWASRHMHVEDGFSLVASCGDRPVGLLGVRWRQLPRPFTALREGYIDILHVLEEYRREGIARRLVELSLARAQAAGAVQIRAWSSVDKTEAMWLWNALGFAVCPVTHSMWGADITGCFVVKRLDHHAWDGD
jgi:GNAT superfamily N-acetyltransferase